MSELKAVSLQVTNVLGISEITIDLSGKVTEISGRNGQGKTSCIQALQSVFTSSESATLLKNGASHGKAVLILNDGTQIINSLKVGKGGKRAMFDAEGRTIPRAATEIDGLFDPHSLNPVDFFIAKGKNRIDILLEAMPIDLDLDRFKHLCGPRIIVKHAGVDALSLIAGARRELYDLRTGDNRVAKDTDATIRTLQQSLDGAAPFDDERLQECNSIVAKIEGELKKTITRIKGNYASQKSACDAAINSAAKKKEELKQAYEKKCRELDSEIKEFTTSIGNDLSSAKQKIKGFEQQSALTKSSTNTEIELLLAAQSAFKAQKVTRESIKKMQDKVEKYTGSAVKLTGSIDSIDAYKTELLSNMLIKGLSIDGDKLMLDGILFDRVNTAKRVGVAMQLAKLRAGKLGLILVDGLLELMDSETLKEFYTQANESGCQIVVTRVKDEELKITNPNGISGFESKLLN